MENRGILARLMAVENITVEHRNTQTASFDVLNRVLTLPTWKAMSAELYDLLRAHEVGHALETPAAGWHGTVIKDRKLKSFLNVVEDARIEKLIKNRFPGLRPSFVKGYKELFEQDFFGVRNKDFATLLLVDRINLHFKIGSHLNVPFDQQEQKIVDRVAQAQTWDDVVALAKEIYDFDAEELKRQIELQLEEMRTHGPNSMDGETAEGEFEDGDADGEGEDEDDPLKVGGKGASGNRDPRPTKILDDWYTFSEEETGQPESMTDAVFRRRELELLDENVQPRIYVDVPTPKLHKMIIPYKQVLKEFVFRCELIETTEDKVLEIMKFAEFKMDFMTRNKRFVEHMIREFEIRRNARQLARAGTAKTGALNLKKIHQYKLTDDLFQRLMVVPKGKSHGMIMVFDQSGSMGDYYAQTLEQIVVLAMFCRGINVPFHVYGFTDNRDHIKDSKIRYHDDPVFSHNTNELSFYGHRTMRLREYFTHSQSSSEFKAMVNRVLQMACIWRTRTSYLVNLLPVSERLHGTPLNEAIVGLMHLVPEFKKAHRLDVVNTIMLTDGESNGATTKWAENSGQDADSARQQSFISRYAGPAHIVFRHKASMIETSTFTTSDNRDPRMTAALIRLLSELTGTRTIGYLISSNHRHQVKDWYVHNHVSCSPTEAESFAEAASYEIRKTGFQLIQNPDLSGYDSFYRVSSKFLDFKEEELETKAESSNVTRDLRKAFLKLHGDKRKHRMLLTNFITQIA